MPKEPSAIRLPPLTGGQIGWVQHYEQAAIDRLTTCSHPPTFNQAKALRILRICVIEVFDYVLGYYSSLPNYRREWLPEIKGETIDSAVGMLPHGVQRDPYILELSRTIDDHLAAKKAEAKPKPDALPVDRKKLYETYLAKFPGERILIRDICWAARQHYREWKRWLNGEIKAGSTPDIAFRRILASDKRPHEMRKEQRKRGWE